MSELHVFLDETPGETRGVIARDGQFTHLLIQRDDDPLQHRLGAKSVGRVVRVAGALKGAFVDLGCGEPLGFLPVKDRLALSEGAKVEVLVSSEPRGGKGPGLRLLGKAEGEPRLVAAGPTVRDQLAALAPGVEPIEGAAAIVQGRGAEEEAFHPFLAVESLGLHLSVERTRALIAVDLDWISMAKTAYGARDRANARGLAEAARMIRLKRWGGLVAVDLIGGGQDGGAVLQAARRAFAGEPEIVFGPVNRFGVLMASLPWRLTPIEELLNRTDGRPTLRTRAQMAVRAARHALLADTSIAVLTTRCAPDEAALAERWFAALGPRARLVADATMQPGKPILESGPP